MLRGGPSPDANAGAETRGGSPAPRRGQLVQVPLGDCGKHQALLILLFTALPCERADTTGTACAGPAGGLRWQHQADQRAMLQALGLGPEVAPLLPCALPVAWEVVKGDLGGSAGWQGSANSCFFKSS